LAFTAGRIGIVGRVVIEQLVLEAARVIVGKRSNAVIVYVAFAVIVLSLLFLAFKRGRTTIPEQPPLHQQN
jgi:high-affinity Fe2+/Pb2+ permease